MLRLGAVSYLNTGPLVEGLDREVDRFAIRFDVPARCAALLHENQVDLGLIPSIEYLHGEQYQIVPGVSIASDGPVASVALFSQTPIVGVESIALDASSRTSVALLKILCARWFHIQPVFVTMAPVMNDMLQRCDAALVIGDNALFADHEGLEKIDLGEEWIGMTGLPFIYAFWAGRRGVATTDDVAALNRARDRGVADLERVAARYFPGDSEKIRRGADYLRENVKYALGEREQSGLREFYRLSAELGLVTAPYAIEFFEGRVG